MRFLRISDSGESQSLARRISWQPNPSSAVTGDHRMQRVATPVVPPIMSRGPALYLHLTSGPSLPEVSP